MKIKGYELGNDLCDVIVHLAMTVSLSIVYAKYKDVIALVALLVSAMMATFKIIEVSVSYFDGKYHCSQNYEHILAIKPLSRFVGYIFDNQGSKIEVIRIPYDNSIQDKTIYMEYSVIEED